MTKYSTKGRSAATKSWPKAKAKRAKPIYKPPTAARIEDRRKSRDFETRLALLELQVKRSRANIGWIFKGLGPRTQKKVLAAEEE